MDLTLHLRFYNLFTLDMFQSNKIIINNLSEVYFIQADFIVSLNGVNWSKHKIRDHWSIDSRKTINICHCVAARVEHSDHCVAPVTKVGVVQLMHHLTILINI